MLLREISSEGSRLAVQFILQVPVRLVTLFSQLSRCLLENSREALQLRGQTADCVRATLLFSRQPSCHLVDFFANVLFQRGEALFEVMT